MNKQIKFKHIESLQITNNIDRIREIINSKVLENAATTNRSSLCESALTEFLIRLKDLLKKCDEINLRINFTDDICIENGDITDLVFKMRNIVCHTRSEGRFLKDNVLFCFSIIGPKRTAGYGEGITNNSSNDILFSYGDFTIYYERQLIRAYNEAKEILINIKTDPPEPGFKGGAFGCAWI